MEDVAHNVEDADGGGSGGVGREPAVSHDTKPGVHSYMKWLRGRYRAW